MKRAAVRVFEALCPPVVAGALRAAVGRLRHARRSVATPHVARGGPIAGLRMVFEDPDEESWKRRMLDGAHDAELFAALADDDLDGAVVCDVGGHVGYHTLAFATRVGARGRVHVFEPSPANVRRITENLAANPHLTERAQVHAYALSDRAGHERFHFTDDVERGTASGGFVDSADTLLPREDYARMGFTAQSVELRTLDEVTAAWAVGPRLLKIDVEGAEGAVLRGARETLRRHRPIVAVEVHSIANMFETAEALHAAGYALRVLSRESDGRCLVLARG